MNGSILHDVRRLVPDAVIATSADEPALRAAARELGRTIAVVSPDRLELVAAHARVMILPAAANDEAALLAALAGHGLYRAAAAPLPSGALVVERRTAADAVSWYERLVARLRREVDVYHAVSLEYRALAEARDRDLDRLAAATPREGAPAATPHDGARLPATTPVFALGDALVELRARFAPPASVRTRALDVATTWSLGAASAALRLFDRRDAVLERLRRARSR